MTGNLPPSASVRLDTGGKKLCAPSASRNVGALCDVLTRHAPASGKALEIASGTGQHIVAFARACPGLVWQPTEIEGKCRASIEAHRAEAGLGNIRQVRQLNAAQPGWHHECGGMSLVIAINLLHLVPEHDARQIVVEAMAALVRGGRFILYGPFMRGGELTSVGDARFHAQLIGANRAIGYKNDADVRRWLTEAGATGIETEELPANNLAFIATR